MDTRKEHSMEVMSDDWMADNWDDSKGEMMAVRWALCSADEMVET